MTANGGSWPRLAPVLEVAQRESVYAIKVIDVPHAFVGLHARTVVLIYPASAQTHVGR